MARLEDIPPATRESILALDCPVPTAHPWVEGPPLSERRIAVISTAALIERDTAPFMVGSAEFRELPASLPPSDILLSHVSINFDRQGWQRDINTVYPIDRLREFAVGGIIGGLSKTNFSVMGSTDPRMMEETADSIVARAARDSFDAVLLCPV